MAQAAPQAAPQAETAFDAFGVDDSALLAVPDPVSLVPPSVCKQAAAAAANAPPSAREEALALELAQVKAALAKSDAAARGLVAAKMAVEAEKQAMAKKQADMLASFKKTIAGKNEEIAQLKSALDGKVLQAQPLSPPLHLLHIHSPLISPVRILGAWP